MLCQHIVLIESKVKCMNIKGIKRFFFGAPFPSSREMHERLDKVRGLAVFASDPISSNAYATEAIMSVLIVLGSGALYMTLPIAIGVAVLVLLVVFSYIQTILHYPEGGGAYIVAKDNLGKYPSLAAGAALLTDYILTVSVSVSAGVRAVTSAFPELLEYRVVFAIGAILFITWINLRGARESGTIFAVPTYAFVGGVWVVIAIGMVRYLGLFGSAPILPLHEQVAATTSVEGFAYIWLILRAFAGGCTALTGIEAISDGVQAFKSPESKNAALTMLVMGVMAMSLFLGITFLATHLELVPHEGESILSQLTRQIAGDGVLYYWVQAFTALILFLAANTGYQDFPRLSSFLSRDGFLPRWLQSRGDRLVFNFGIYALALFSSLIVLVFQADEVAMLPLYALGVMLSFSLSQAGMFRLMGRIRHLKPGQKLRTLVTEIHYESNAIWKQALNALGATVTSVVFLILAATKFLEGAWIVLLLIPLTMLLFHSVDKHYQNLAHHLSTRRLSVSQLPKVADVVVVPVAGIHRGNLLAIQYAKRLSRDVRVVSIITNPETKKHIQKRWRRFSAITRGVKLVLIEHDYRDIFEPLEEYITKVNNQEFPNKLTTVVIPEFVTESWLARLLHSGTADRLKARLVAQKDIVIIDVPYHAEAPLLNKK